MRKRTSGPEMGDAREAQYLSDAAGGPAPHPHVVRSAVNRLFASCDGVTAVEYGILCGLMTVVIISAVYYMGNQALTQLFNKIASSL